MTSFHDFKSVEKNPRIIALTGGIGSGKSVVAEILRILGYNVIDTDRLAKQLMDSDNSIKKSLINEISPETVNVRGEINRSVLSAIVFSDADKLSALNKIVHSAVRKSISDTILRHSVASDKPIFIETAILFTSQLDKMVNEVWRVEADETTRILRIINRNKCSRQDALARINAQKEETRHNHPHTVILRNDDSTPLLPQILALI